MTSFEGFVVEELIRSGSDRIPCFEFLTEDYPCEDCPCQDACSKGLSCQAFMQYLHPSKKHRMKWVDMLRIPTHAGFQMMFGE